jgi:hypothetical protein
MFGNTDSKIGKLKVDSKNVIMLNDFNFYSFNMQKIEK